MCRELFRLFSLLQKRHQAPNSLEHEERESNHVPVHRLVERLETLAGLAFLAFDLSHGERAGEKDGEYDNEDRADEGLGKEAKLADPGHWRIEGDYYEAEEPEAEILILSQSAPRRNRALHTLHHEVHLAN